MRYVVNISFAKIRVNSDDSKYRAYNQKYKTNLNMYKMTCALFIGLFI